ncbi:hypothetical protein [Bremerella cremea]|uniref:hypothetical protein n=1 Tax=Bremerella cremea TaxID=1031537 RepID=UPI0031EA334B
MPSVLQIQKLGFHTLGRACLVLLATVCLLNSVLAAEPAGRARLRIQPVSPSRSAVQSTPSQIRMASGEETSGLQPVIQPTALTLLQPPSEAASTPPSPPAQITIQAMPKPATAAGVTPENISPPLPASLQAIANDRGRLSNKPESFFKSLTPEDREILYDGKPAQDFGIGRTYDYDIDGKEVTPPTNIAAKIFSEEPTEDFPYGYHHDWYPMVAMWEAPGLYHRPLYFEEVNLERYGNQHIHLQPVYSTAHFFANTLTLPYKMGAYHPCERIYTLGHYRPGDCNPHDVHTTPFTWKGVIYTGAVYSGIGAAFP